MEDENTQPTPAASEPAPAVVKPQRRSLGGRRSIGGGRRRSFGTPLAVPLADDQAQASHKTVAAIQDMYKKINDIVQLSSENKITTKNAWSLGVNVVDIMDSVMEESGAEAAPTRGQPSVNFQKASCKLDASVKIYSVRVDDTHQTSYRILENLTRTKALDQDSDKPQVKAAVGEKATSNKFCLSSTLEKNVKNLNMTSLDKNLAVDPYFHKMSHLFDKGGAHGLLLSNISVFPGYGCRMQLGDPIWSEEEEKELKADGELDMGPLTSRVQAKIDQEFGGKAVERLPLCDELADIRREIAELQGVDAPSGKSAEEDDDSDGEDGNYGGYECHDEEDDWSPEQIEDQFVTSEGGAGEASFSSAEYDTVGPLGTGLRRRESTAVRGILDAISADQLVESEYSFFDAKRLEAMNLWAGASHWRFGRARSTPKPATKEPADAEKGAKRGKRARGQQAIDFTAQEPENLASVLALAKGKAGMAGLQLSATALKRAATVANGGSQYCLPEDVKFAVGDLAKLFLRPQAVANAVTSGSSDLNSSNPWSDSRPSRFSMLSPVKFGVDGDALDDSFGDYDAGGGDMSFGDAAEDDQADTLDVDMSKMLAPARRVEKIHVHHETRAKKVDVRRLKKDIWSDLESNLTEGPSELPATKDQLPAEHVGAGEEGDVNFSQVMSRVHSVQRQSEVTSPFYFICVLHLANEKGLKLEGQKDLTDFKITLPTPNGEAGAAGSL